MQIFLSILVAIAILGVLIMAHEAGHLAVAKIFNVYCLEYSIGFGPKIFTIKPKKGRETAFSLRWIPLGGYVSMYGEGVDLPDGVTVPESRSLQGIKRWKAALIFSAGIVVNIILSLVFALFYSTCFPTYYTGARVGSGLANPYDNGNSKYVVGFYGESDTASIAFDSKTDLLETPFLFISSSGQTGGYLIDADATITRGTEVLHRVALYYPAHMDGQKNDFFSCLTFYPQKSLDEATLSFSSDASDDFISVTFDAKYQESKALNDTQKAFFTAMGSPYFPDFDSGATSLFTDDFASVDVTVLSSTAGKTGAEIYAARKTANWSSTATGSGTDIAWKSNDFALTSQKYWADGATRMADTGKTWVSYWTSLGEGIKMIFTGNAINSIGGPIAMTQAVATFSASIGYGKTFFYYGGFISLNLGLFNLLPFPGLDGWSLFVTALEGIINLIKRGKYKRNHPGESLTPAPVPAGPTAEGEEAPAPAGYQEWKIPTKIKNIVSYVGLGILMVLALFIAVNDIVRIVVK
jgi:membrane-associated protease RseP (regulator of RpoE activity)